MSHCKHRLPGRLADPPAAGASLGSRAGVATNPLTASCAVAAPHVTAGGRSANGSLIGSDRAPAPEVAHEESVRIAALPGCAACGARAGRQSGHARHRRTAAGAVGQRWRHAGAALRRLRPRLSHRLCRAPLGPDHHRPEPCRQPRQRPSHADSLGSYGATPPTGPFAARLDGPGGASSGSVEARGSGSWQLPDSISVASRALPAVGPNAYTSTSSRFDLTDDPLHPGPSLFQLAPHTTVTLSGIARYETAIDLDRGGSAQTLFYARWSSVSAGSDLIQLLSDAVHNEAVTLPGTRGEVPWQISLTNGSGSWAEAQLDFFAGTAAGTFALIGSPVPEPAEGLLTGAGLLALACWLRRQRRPARAPAALQPA